MLVDRELFDILRGFASLQPTHLLKWPAHTPPHTTHDFLLNSLLLDTHLESHPPSAQYQKGFWKWAIEHLEDAAEFEIDPRIYGRYLKLLPPSGSPSCVVALGHPPPVDSFITHYWLPRPQDTMAHSTLVNTSRYQKATLLESQRVIESGTTGLRTWLASFVLAQYLIRHPELVAHQHVLELGSGVGFLGIIVAALQMSYPTQGEQAMHSGSLNLTDVNDQVLDRCRSNLGLACNLSSKHAHLDVQLLDWSASLGTNRRSTLLSLLQNSINPTIILGADIVFDPSLIPALVGVLKLAMLETSGGSVRYALIALTVRNETTIDAFLTQIQDTALKPMEVSTGFGRETFFQSVDAPPGQEFVKLFKITA